MAERTYVRVTVGGAVVTGETGTWIPVTDLDLQASGSAGTTPQSTLSFALGNDDAIIDKLDNQAITGQTGFKIEVATYDTSTASAGSAGTLLSYAVSSSALITSQSTTGAGAATYPLALSNISQTTYPQAAQPSSSAYAQGTGSIAATPAPANVVDGSSVAASTSTAPAGAGLTYYARFTGVQGVDSNAFYNIDDVLTGSSRGISFAANGGARVQNPTIDDLSFNIQNLQGVDFPLFAADGLQRTFSVQIEAVAGSGSSAHVVDNGTYSGVSVDGLDNLGNYALAFTDYQSQHFNAAGSVVSQMGYNLATTMRDTNAPTVAAAVPSSSSGVGQPFATSDIFFDSPEAVSSDPAQGSPQANAQITGFSFSTGKVASVTADQKVQSSVSEASFTTYSRTLALDGDRDVFLQGAGQPFKVDQGFADLSTLRRGVGVVRDYALTNGLFTGDAIDLVSGQRTYALNFTRIEQENNPSRAYSGIDVAPTPPANTAFIQFRDPTTGALLQSSSGQSWFALDQAQFQIGRSVGGTGDGSERSTTPPSYSELQFSTGQNAVTSTLDTAMLNNTSLTAEVATYGSNGALQSDYVFGSGAFDAHSYAAGSSAQTFSFKTSIFQETQYDDSGAAIGSFNYYKATNSSGESLASNATHTAPAASSTPATLDSYVQFVGSNGVAVIDASGASWFKISGTSSGLAEQNGTTYLSALTLNLGNTDVATQLHADLFAGTGVAQVNVTSYDPSGALQSYQRYTGVTVGATGSDATVDNTGGDNAVSFAYMGYGERTGTGVTSATASAGTNPSVPTALDQATPEPVASTAPSLSNLSFIAELKAEGAGAFVGSSSGFVATPTFSIDLSTKTATFAVDQSQAAALAQDFYNQPARAGSGDRLEIAGYDPGGGRSVDYILSGTSLSSVSLDTATGVDSVTLGFTDYKETNTDALLANRTASTGGASGQTIDAPQNAEPAVCFCTGTLLRVVRGSSEVDVAVETLAVGDLVVTSSGEHRPIRWLGHRAIMQPAFELYPIRIRQGAFGRDALGADLPRRDLTLSPGHPVLVGADADGEGGVLVPVMCLVNGTTVERVPVPSVTYWHVELDAHDILLAEGLPAESYLDWGDRAFFSDAPAHALANPDFVAPGLGLRCRPVALDGPVVEAERLRLDAVFAATLASQCGWDEFEESALATG